MATSDEGVLPTVPAHRYMLARLRWPTRDVVVCAGFVAVLVVIGCAVLLGSDDVWLLRHGREVEVRVVERIEGSDYLVVAGDTTFVTSIADDDDPKVGRRFQLLVDPDDVSRNMQPDTALAGAIIALMMITTPITAPLIWWLALRSDHQRTTVPHHQLRGVPNVRGVPHV